MTNLSEDTTAPTPSVSVLCKAIQTAVSLEPSQLTGMFSLKAIPSNSDTSRPPAVIIAVVDRSGSMGGDKIRSLKQTLQFTINELTHQDQLAIVEYDSIVRTTLPLTFMNDTGKRTAVMVTRSISCGNKTNLCGGLVEAMKLLPAKLLNTVASILLLTDGYANEGIHTTEGIIRTMNLLQQSGVSRCSINTFGFGEDHDATMLKQIANASDGMYYFIRSPSCISTTFADCLGGITSSVAQKIEVTVDAKGKNFIGTFQTKKPVTEVIPGKKYRILLGDIQEGECRDIPFTMKLSGCETPQEIFPVANISLSYYDLKNETLEDSSCVLTIARKLDLSETDVAQDVDVSLHCNRFLAASATEKANTLATSGRLDEARQELRVAMSSILTSAAAREEMSETLLTEIQESSRGLASRDRYRSYGQYQMNMMASTFHDQRAAVPMYAHQKPHFETPSRKLMKQRFHQRAGPK